MIPRRAKLRLPRGDVFHLTESTNKLPSRLRKWPLWELKPIATIWKKRPKICERYLKGYEHHCTGRKTPRGPALGGTPVADAVSHPSSARGGADQGWPTDEARGQWTLAGY